MKNKLSILLITSLSLILSACGAKTEPTEAQLPAESESGFYEDTLEIIPSFELLQTEMTLECGTPFNTDDLSKYIKADNFDDILVNIYWIEKTKSQINEENIPEDRWSEVGLRPATFKVIFTDYTTEFSQEMNLIYNDTVAPIVTLKDENGIETSNASFDFNMLSYGMDYNDPENAYKIMKDESGVFDDKYYFYSITSNYFALEEILTVSDSNGLLKYEAGQLSYNHDNLKVYFESSNDFYINPYSLYDTPGTYEEKLIVEDASGNRSELVFTFNMIEDIPDNQKESLSDEEYNQLYNDYLSRKE